MTVSCSICGKNMDVVDLIPHLEEEHSVRQVIEMLAAVMSHIARTAGGRGK